MSATTDGKRFVDMNDRETKLLVCSICLNIFENAVSSECGHTYCKHCVHQWIVQYNNNKCPECRQLFRTRHRSYDMIDNYNNLVIIGNNIFSRNLIVNAMVSELKVLCDFEFNGCKTLVKYGLLSAHLKVCEHRFCKTCDFAIGKVDEHNCITLLISDRNDWKQKFVEQESESNDLRDTVSQLEVKLAETSEDRDLWKQKSEEQESVIECLTEKLSELAVQEQSACKERDDWKLKYEDSHQLVRNLNDQVCELVQLETHYEINKIELDLVKQDRDQLELKFNQKVWHNSELQQKVERLERIVTELSSSTFL